MTHFLMLFVPVVQLSYGKLNWKGLRRQRGKRTVQVGVIEEQLAEVRDGLAHSEKVVTSGAGRLRTGAEIIVQDLTNKNETDKSQGSTSQEDRR